MSSDTFFSNTEKGELTKHLSAAPVQRLIPVAQDSRSRQVRSPSRETPTTEATTTTTAMVEVPEDELASSIVPDVMFTSSDALFWQLKAVLRNSDMDSLVVGQVSADTYRALKAKRDRHGYHYRFFFIPDVACIIVTCPTLHHERAHLEVYARVYSALMRMGVEDQWTHSGSAELDAQGGASGSGQGDSSGGPLSRRDQVDDDFWPTLVVEAGASQSLPSLRIKARWWFAASNFHMKVVVLVKLIAATFTIQIEQWVAEARGPQRHGATTTWAGRAAKQPVLEQQVSIDWVGLSPLNQTPFNRRALANFRVVGAPLVLRFEDLMERPPVPAAGEHDVVISEANLQMVAKCVW
ncbi:dead deah box dna helicase [Ophiostoma piceae UAMH 11346]|uniref:Dead deah box dna helicase n=1 Tax=Ophiostoma piceae (strain UAMH 11346) TaxID=1262450 RepID=S3C0W9_OPHP1|nr:dead deah box dna helicase [Ophiostoma piceae UAMH 11346]